MIADLQRRVDIIRHTGHLNVPIPLAYVIQLIKQKTGAPMPTKAVKNVKVEKSKTGKTTITPTSSRRKSVSAKIAERKSRKPRVVSPAKAKTVKRKA